MDQYPVFSLYELNSPLEDDRARYQIRAMAPGQHAFSGTEAYPSFDAARQGARREAERRLARAREAVKGWEQQLARLDEFYASPMTPAQAIAQHRDAIVQALRHWDATGEPSFHTTGCLTMYPGYLGHNDLVVFAQAEFDNVGLPFTQADVDVLLELVREAGIEVVEQMANGAGAWTFSFKVAETSRSPA